MTTAKRRYYTLYLRGNARAALYTRRAWLAHALRWAWRLWWLCCSLRGWRRQWARVTLVAHPRHWVPARLADAMAARLEAAQHERHF